LPISVSLQLYDRTRYVKLFSCAKKLTSSPLNLPHGTKKNRNSNKEKLKTKNEMLRKRRSGHEVRGVSSGARRESMVGKISERNRFKPDVQE